MPDIPLNPDKQASAASPSPPPVEGASRLATPKGQYANTNPPEEPAKTDQTVPGTPPVAPPRVRSSPPPTVDLAAKIDKLEGGGPPRPDRGRSIVSFLVSAMVHAAIMIALAMVVVASQNGGRWGDSFILSSTIDEPQLEQEHLVSDVPTVNTVRDHNAHTSVAPAPMPDVNPILELEPTEEAPMQIGSDRYWPDAWGAPAYVAMGGGLDGRSNRAGRSGDGASDESEEAVERGLWWLVAHQNADGGWSFDHQGGNCRGLCGNPGSNKSTTAATALALAPFLGAGYTHQHGEHTETVRKGLYYLQRRGFDTPDGIDLMEGTMYGQGLASIVLCEAYAMTRDKGLLPVAQGALDFIEYAQADNGGWRYKAKEPGDTTVTGWMLMALKSGDMAGLEVRSTTMYMVNDFLDTVQSEEGAKYGYQTRAPKPATTAVGLLCRMYLGWPRSHPGLAAGVRYLDELGPSQNDMYFNYYATQVMHHWQGSEWKRWNDRMRDYLIQTQAGGGHENGSWYFPHTHSEEGGRLYNTAMAIMTLEVYYRYMPLYKERATQ